MSPYGTNKPSPRMEVTGFVIMTIRRSIAHRHVLDTLAERENISWKSLRAQLDCRPQRRRSDAPLDHHSRSNEEPGWTCRNRLCSDGYFDQSRWGRSGIPTSPRLARFTLLQRRVYTHRRRSNCGVSGPPFVSFGSAKNAEHIGALRTCGRRGSLSTRPFRNCRGGLKLCFFALMHVATEAAFLSRPGSWVHSRICWRLNADAWVATFTSAYKDRYRSMENGSGRRSWLVHTPSAFAAAGLTSSGPRPR